MNGTFVITPIIGVLLGLAAGLAIGAIAALLAWRSGRRDAVVELAAVRERLDETLTALDEERRARTVAETRLDEQQRHHDQQKTTLENAEKRLNEAFERLAGRVFEDRAKKLGELNEKQIDTLLKPLGEKLNDFRRAVTESHQEETKSHAALRERLLHLEKLNERLNEEARNLTRALTADVKSQGAWGEQQLERLLELAGLRRGEHYMTQYSVIGQDGQRLQPDLVLLLPEGRTIVMDSKVSLTAWTRLQAATDDAEREALLAEHVASVRAHIEKLGAKNYPDVEELNALDFVLMFVPIEAAMIAALQSDSALTEHALRHRVALLSPANFLATVRTVASVWQVHRQNTNAQDIARRAGLLYDKFVGFTDNLRQVGQRLDQARKAYDDAFGQLSTGAGNLVGQAEKLRQLGAKHSKQLEQNLLERSGALDEGDADPDGEAARLKLVRTPPEE